MEPPPKRHAPKGRLKADPIQGIHPMRGGKPAGARGCTAHTRSGALCAGIAISGGVVCRMHGGAAPQVKLAAQERLAMLVDPAILRLGQLVDQTEFPSVAIAAVKDVLDRNLGKAAEQVKVTGADDGPLEIIVKKSW